MIETNKELFYEFFYEELFFFQRIVYDQNFKFIIIIIKKIV